VKWESPAFREGSSQPKLAVTYYVAALGRAVKLGTLREAHPPGKVKRLARQASS
jgi:hypothetical protein